MCPSYLESLADNIRIDKDKCTFCGKCVERCILDNMRMKLAPCRQACPMGVNVQGYVQLILRGKEQAARELIREQLPFPEVVCMVCDHPCESACHRGRQDGPAVGICALKRYLFDTPETLSCPAQVPSTGKRIAVVGAGPAGLVAAYDLALKGHAVTVFEAGDKPGGLLQQGIPTFRLPAATVERELSILSKLGVILSCNCTVGRDVMLQDLRRDFGAVILASGLAGVKKLGIEGEDTAGVHEGIAFLRAISNGHGPILSGSVVVIGGGNVAVDTALAALRQGAGQVFLVSLEKEDALPAFANEINQARAEGVHFQAGWGPLRILENRGKLSGVLLHKCTSVFDAQGRFNPVFAENETQQLDVEHLIVAIGQRRDTSLLAGSSIDAEKLATADPLTLQYDDSTVFVAGELYSGPGSVILSMAQGRKAAESAHRLVMGEDLAFNRAYPGPVLTEFPIDTTYGSDTPHVEPVVRLPSGKGDYTLVECVLTREQAQAEASRCYSCGGPCGHHRTCWFCLPCEVDCPEKALYVEIPYLLR